MFMVSLKPTMFLHVYILDYAIMLVKSRNCRFV